jgi:hypothetical protein
MTELTQVPDPNAIIRQLQSVCLEKLEQGDKQELQKAREVVSWSLALVHCFDIQAIPEKHRKAAFGAEQVIGQEGAVLMLRLADSQHDLYQITKSFQNFTEDVEYLCGEVSTSISVAYSKAIECPTAISS